MSDRVFQSLSLLSEDISIRWMMTLLHFLWQGAVVGFVVAIGLRLLRNSTATLRYTWCLAVLVSLPVLVLVTFAAVDVPVTQQQNVSTDSAAAVFPSKSGSAAPVFPRPKLSPELAPHAPQMESSHEVAVAMMPQGTALKDAAGEAPAEADWLRGCSRIARRITLLYACGVCVFLLRLGIALRSGSRLRSTATQLTDSGLLELIATEAGKVGLRFVPAVAWCERVAVPTVIGILRPVVLLPASVMTGLTTAEFATIVAHEFAHIRRYVLWVNLLQRGIESMLFFHPVVWFVSRRLSAEREICADDLVVSSGNEPMNYASALLRMAELCETSRRPNAVALAVSGPRESLLEHRIIRLINIDRTPRLQLPEARTFFAGLSLVLAAVFLSVAFQSPLKSGGPVDSTTSSQAIAPPLNGTPALPVVDKAEQLTGNNSKVRVMKMTVVDEQGQPIRGAKIFAHSWRTTPEFRDKRKIDYFTDENGNASVEFVPGLKFLSLSASSPGYVTLNINWGVQETDKIPVRYNVTLQRATELGGIVVDPDGKPIRGAKVQVSCKSGAIKIDTNNNSALNPWLAEDEDAAETDGQGRWTIRNAPAGDNLELELTVEHPEFLCEPNRAQLTRFGLTLESLRNKSGTIRLNRGIPVTGRVVDPQGMPVPEAMIVRGDQPYEESGSQETKTDEQGHFRIPPQKPGPLRLTVVAQNWMPQTLIVDVQNDIAPVEFQMTPGRKLHLTVVDPEGNPFPETYVHLASWRGIGSLYNTNFSDLMDSRIPREANEDGEYSWDWAPDDAITVQIKAVKNHRTVAERQLELIADDTIQVITLAPVFKLSGTVINAATKEPVTGYVVHPITYSSAQEDARGNVLSDRISIFQTSNFSLDFNGAPDMIQNAYRFESPGFRTYRTRRYGISEPAASFTVELEATDVQSGRVLNSDGTAAPSAKVSIVHPEDLFIIDGAEDYRMERYVDASGEFQHATQTTKFAVVAASEDGYAEKYCQPGELIGHRQFTHAGTFSYDTGTAVPAISA